MNLKKLERYLRVNLLGPGPCLVKIKNLPNDGLTKFNPLQTNRRLLYLKTQFVPRCKHFSSRL